MVTEQLNGEYVGRNCECSFEESLAETRRLFAKMNAEAEYEKTYGDLNNKYIAKK